MAAHIWKSMCHWFCESSILDLSLSLNQRHSLKLLPTSPSSNTTSRPEPRDQHTSCPLAESFYSHALTNPIPCSLILLGLKNLAPFFAPEVGGSFYREELGKLNVHTTNWGVVLGNATTCLPGWVLHLSPHGQPIELLGLITKRGQTSPVALSGGGAASWALHYDHCSWQMWKTGHMFLIALAFKVTAT